MIEIHYVQDGDRWWAYTQNDNGFVTAVANAKTQGKARLRLFKKFWAQDYVDNLVNGSMANEP